MTTMQLTRTERLILETAAEKFCLSWSPTEAAMLTEIVLTPEEQARWQGRRPQLGELLVARGELTESMLDDVLEAVYADVRLLSDRLAPPRPAPVPRPPAPPANGEDALRAELTELVAQLTALLDRLVGEGALAAPAEPAAPAESAARRVDTLAPTPALDRSPREDEAPTRDGLRLAGPAAATADDPDEAPTRAGGAWALRTDAAPPNEGEAADRPAAGDATLQRERPLRAATEGRTQRSERVRGPDPADPTLEVERPPPPEETLQLERKVPPGDTLKLEPASLKDAS